MKLQVLTNSRLKAVRACQRYHHLRYNLGYAPVEDAEALRFGTLIHKGLEAWFLAEHGARLTPALEAISAAEADPFDLAKATVLLCGYDQRWGAEEFETVAVEVMFSSLLVNPETGGFSKTFRLEGKIDALIRQGGRLLLVEHKTASEDIGVGSDYWKRLRLDGQVSTYFDGAEALGYEPDSCLYDVIRKPALRPLTATPVESRRYTKDGRLYANQRDQDETPAEYQARLVEAVAEDPDRFYQRGEVTRLEAELAEARWDRWQLARQIREGQLRERFPRNPDACVRFGTCAFFPYCSGEASLDDPTRYRRLEDVNPELAA